MMMPLRALCACASSRRATPFPRSRAATALLALPLALALALGGCNTSLDARHADASVLDPLGAAPDDGAPSADMPDLGIGTPDAASPAEPFGELEPTAPLSPDQPWLEPAAPGAGDVGTPDLSGSELPGGDVPGGDVPGGDVPGGLPPVEDAGDGLGFGSPDGGAAPVVPVERAPLPAAPAPGAYTGPVPPRPPPPRWDPSRDRVVRLGPDGRPLAEGVPSDDSVPPAAPEEGPGPAATGGFEIPGSPDGVPMPPAEGSPDLPGTPVPGPVVPGPVVPGPVVPEPVVPGPVVSGPVAPGAGDPGLPAPAPGPSAPVDAGSDGLGLPPGGGAPAPIAEPPAPARSPEPRRAPAPAPSSPWLSDQPAGPVPAPAPPPVSPADPGLPPTAVPPAPLAPEPARPTPGPTVPAPAPDDPWLPGGTAAPAPAPGPAPVPPAPAPSDPWLPGAAVPSPDGPTPAAPAPGAPVAPPSDDPWLPGPGPGTSAPDRPAPAPAPTPGAYAGATPEARLREHVTRLIDNPGAPEVAGYPAEIMPSADAGMALTSGRRPAVVVFFDDSDRASDLQASRLLPVLVRYRDRIDFVAIDRGPAAMPSGGEAALSAKYLEGVPTVAVLDAARKTRFYKSGPVGAADFERALAEVLEAPADAPPATPPAAPPTPWEPSTPDPFAPPGPTQPAAPTPPADESRGGMTFTPPLGYSAREHIDRLRANPGSARVPGYPQDLLPSAPAERVLASGHKPIVLIFYDDTSKASDLQAADFLPVLVRRKAEFELVLIDVSTVAEWTQAEKTVVRTYYNFYVPTTVVLAANRAPVKSWYSRIKGEDLDRAITDATDR